MLTSVITGKPMSSGPAVIVLVLASAAALCGCSNSSETPREAAALRDLLAAVGGSYEWNDEVKRYVFSDKLAIEKVIGEGNDAVVRELMECLDDSRASQTTLKGRAVPVGIVCYQALSQTVYYEATTPSGDIAERWPGHIEPTASAAELAAAKRAWRIVIEKKAYKRL